MTPQQRDSTGYLLLTEKKGPYISESLKTIEVTLPQASVGRLEKLQAKMEVDSIAVVLANALRLFEAVVEETEQGTKFFIQREGLEIEPFEIFEQETKI